MKRAAVLLLALVLGVTSGRAAHAQGLERLYDEARLRLWQPQFTEDIRWHVDNTILPRLTPAERRQLGAVTIEHPLTGKQPLEFVAYPPTKTITMPVLSLRFLADLLLAHAWLEANGYSPSTVPQYLGMLKYRPATAFPGGRHPAPLEALRIPSNARDDPRVLASFGTLFTTAGLFVLCHEIGHVFHGHGLYTEVSREQARQNEAQADRFAVELMRRAGMIPFGAPFLFLAFARLEPHRADHASELAWEQAQKQATHPLTADRIRALAGEISKGAEAFARAQRNPAAALPQVRAVAAQIAEVARILDNEEMHRFFRNEARMTELHMLVPRRTDAYVAAVPSEKLPDLPFSGVYEGTFTTASDPGGVAIRAILKRQGPTVVGEYTYAAGRGTLRGTLSGSTLDFDWEEGGFRGKGRFQAAADGKSFTGRWGEGDSADTGGTWSGRRP